MASHFKVAEVQMEALNDPLPPHHPGSSTKESIIPFVALNFSQQQKMSTSSLPMDTLTSKLSNLDQHSEITYPSVTNGTLTNYLKDIL